MKLKKKQRHSRKSPALKCRRRTVIDEDDSIDPTKELPALGVAYFGSKAAYAAWLDKPCLDFQAKLPPSVLIARGQANVVKAWLQRPKRLRRKLVNTE